MSSRRLCDRAAAPHRGYGSIAGTTRRTGCNHSRLALFRGIPPRAVAALNVCESEAGNGFDRNLRRGEASIVATMVAREIEAH
jgi:hypothetical protein